MHGTPRWSLRRISTEVQSNSEDQQFLFALYAANRQKEIDAWGWDRAQQEAFLRMQHTAQQRWYTSAYETAEHSLVLVEEQRAGRLLVLRTSTEILLVDIALLPQYQNHGLGTLLLQTLVTESETSHVPLRLQVQHTNPAKRLYLRIGFTEVSKDDLYSHMERRPSGL